MCLKYLQKTYETLENHCNTYTTFKQNTCNICVSVKQTTRQTFLQHTFEKIDETLETDICNVREQPSQHMQHPDLVLKHPYEILANTTETLETYACNMRLFQHNVALLLGRIELIVVELVAGAEVGGGAWSSLRCRG